MKKIILIFILLATVFLIGCSTTEEIEGNVIPYEEIGEELYGIEYFDHYIYTNKYEIKNGLLYVSSFYIAHNFVPKSHSGLEVSSNNTEYLRVDRGKIISQFVIERIK